MTITDNPRRQEESDAADAAQAQLHTAAAEARRRAGEVTTEEARRAADAAASMLHALWSLPRPRYVRP